MEGIRCGRLHAFATILIGLLVVVGLTGKMTRANFSHGTATWYDDPNGDGSDGGACGYREMIHARGFKKRDTAVSDVMFENGLGCGSCYKVMCFDTEICKRKPVTVVAMDQSPGGMWPHFDLSGLSFFRLAQEGRGGELQNRGRIPIVWKRTPCKHGKKKIVFRVMDGSTSDWFSVLVAFVNGDGQIGSMQLQQDQSEEWLNMTHLWGAGWSVRPPIGEHLIAPFSIRLTGRLTGETLTVNNAIPVVNWTVGATYTSDTNFQVPIHH